MSLQVEGWGVYVLKEKLKLIKDRLKVWHQNHTQNLDVHIKQVKKRNSSLDIKGEVHHLDVVRLEELHSLSSNLMSLSKLYLSILWQNSRLTCLRERGANSKKFHGITVTLMNSNVNILINANGDQIQGVACVRNVVFHNFQNHFQLGCSNRSRIGNLSFKMISKAEGLDLIKKIL